MWDFIISGIGLVLAVFIIACTTVVFQSCLQFCGVNIPDWIAFIITWFLMALTLRGMENGD